MQVSAYAKVNLTLEVTGKRSDGYHELVSLMQTISLADDLELVAADELTLECEWPELMNDDNLVLQAARLLNRTGHFRLTKRVPMAAGLGGGSADAAAALRLLDAVYNLGLSAAEMNAAALVLGSDVPFFLTGGLALVEGRGELVTALPDVGSHWLVLLNPGVPLSTAAVFRELAAEEYGTGEVTRACLGDIGSGGSLGLPAPYNTLEKAALRLEPSIASCREALLAAGASAVSLSGSGPTVFGYADSEEQAESIRTETGGMVARFIGREEALALTD